MVGRKKIYCLAFADDIIVMAYTAAELKDMIEPYKDSPIKVSLLSIRISRKS